MYFVLVINLIIIIDFQLL